MDNSEYKRGVHELHVKFVAEMVKAKWASDCMPIQILQKAADILTEAPKPKFAIGQVVLDTKSNKLFKIVAIHAWVFAFEVAYNDAGGYRYMESQVRPLTELEAKGEAR